MVDSIKKSIEDNNLISAYINIFIIFDKCSQEWYESLTKVEKDNCLIEISSYYENMINGNYDEDIEMYGVEFVKRIKNDYKNILKSLKKAEGLGRVKFEMWWNKVFMEYYEKSNFLVGSTFFSQTDIYKIRNNIVHSNRHSDTTYDIVLEFKERIIPSLGPFGVFLKKNDKWVKVLFVTDFCKMCLDFLIQSGFSISFEKVNLEKFLDLEFLFQMEHEMFKEFIDRDMKLLVEIEAFFEEYTIEDTSDMPPYISILVGVNAHVDEADILSTSRELDRHAEVPMEIKNIYKNLWFYKKLLNRKSTP